jgi:uncharacterized protein YbjT (DUF2867 family)
MRVVLVGASGNVGSAVIKAPATSPGHVHRRGGAAPAAVIPAKTEWVAPTSYETDFEPVVRGADAAVHLAQMFRHVGVTDTRWCKPPCLPPTVGVAGNPVS